jgi:hypothetical protein
MDGWMNGWVGGWVDGWIEIRVDDWIIDKYECIYIYG